MRGGGVPLRGRPPTIAQSSLGKCSRWKRGSKLKVQVPVQLPATVRAAVVGQVQECIPSPRTRSFPRSSGAWAGACWRSRCTTVWHPSLQQPSCCQDRASAIPIAEENGQRGQRGSALSFVLRVVQKFSSLVPPQSSPQRVGYRANWQCSRSSTPCQHAAPVPTLWT